MPGGKVIIPEIVEPDEQLPGDLVALKGFAYLLDEAVAIPGTRKRVGLDAGLGLIPWFGDLIGALLSAWIVFGALRHRVPMLKVVRMVMNILIDLGLGAIPIAGDIFDWLFEENVINMRLLLKYRDRKRPPRSFASIAGAALVVVAIICWTAVLVLAGFVAATVWLIHRYW
ncbi:MAG TPA: DUF4112 domain-containing protein [Thermoanaerobaculia bacterium]|nr:DUF4112 domain-containing protein [Thermoanaerobaculia bacterium]